MHSTHLFDLSAAPRSPVRSEPIEGGMQRDARLWLERVPRLSPALQYMAAVAAAVVAVALRRTLDPAWGDKYPFILFFPAIALSSWLGGLRAGLLTTLLCFAAADYVAESQGEGCGSAFTVTLPLK